MQTRIIFHRVFWIGASVFWIAFIFGRSLQPADQSSQESASVLALIHQIIPFMSMHFLRKAAHFGEFFVLGALLFTTFRVFEKQALLLPAVIGAGVAVTDELLQLISPGRSCQISDMLLDFSGALVGVLLMNLLVRIRRVVHQPSERRQS